MALKISTGLRNYLTGEGSLRKALEDAVLKIYSGTAPATADAAETGVLLATITKSSGAVTSGDRSTPRVYKILIGSYTTGHTFLVAVTVDGVGPTTYTYTAVSADDSVIKVAAKVARMLNDIPQLRAVPSLADGNLYVQCDIDGLDVTLADPGGGSGTLTVTALQSASRVNTLQLGAPAAGVIAKNSDIWSGVAVASGTAGYFRVVTSADSGSSSSTDVRMQGNVSTSGADLNLSNLNIVSGATQTIDTFELTLPVS